MPEIKIDYKLIERVKNITFSQRERRKSAHYGIYKSHRIGSGFEFAGYRPYAYDSFNKIDWNVYGRTEQYFVKNFHEEGNLKIAFIFDNSASLVNHEMTLELSANIALCIINKCLQDKDLVTIYSGESEKKIKSISDFSNFFLTLQAGSNSISRLPRSCDYLYYISDLLYPLKQIEKDIHRLSTLTSSLTIVNPQLKLDLAGDLEIYGIEEGEHYEISINQREYDQKLNDHHKNVDDIINWMRKNFSCKINYVTYTVGESIEDLFIKKM